MIHVQQPATGRDVARHYDDLDLFYRELWGEHVHHGLWRTGDETPEEAAQQLLEHVLDQIDLPSNASVCDVGCGYGATAHYLASRYGADVTALTISPAQYDYARRQSEEPNAPTFLLRDWLKNDLPPAQQDAVLAIECLAHMNDKPAAIAEAYRVLRPGKRFAGCMWLAAENASSVSRRLLLEPICEEGRLPSLPTASMYQHWLRDAGFEIERIEDLSAQVRRTWTVCIQRLVMALLRNSDYRQFLWNSDEINRQFALTMLRLWIAYHIGSFQYGLFVARKPEG